MAMRHISTTLPPPGSVGQTNAGNGNSSRAEHSTTSQLTERHIARLWEKMAKIYGHRWVSSYGEEDDGTWLSALAQLTPAHLAYGLQQCLEAGEEWPPSLPAFRNMCLDINPDTVEREVARIVGAWDWNRMTRDQQAAAVRRHSSQATTRLTQERIECDAPLLPRMP